MPESVTVTAKLPKCTCGQPLLIDYTKAIYLLDLNQICAHAQCNNPECCEEKTSIFINFTEDHQP